MTKSKRPFPLVTRNKVFIQSQLELMYNCQINKPKIYKTIIVNPGIVLGTISMLDYSDFSLSLPFFLLSFILNCIYILGFSCERTIAVSNVVGSDILQLTLWSQGASIFLWMTRVHPLLWQSGIIWCVNATFSLSIYLLKDTYVLLRFS